MPNSYVQPSRSWERTYNIELDNSTKKNLWSYMKHELHYYNTLVNELNGKIRVFPNEIANIKDQYEKLWSTIAQTGVDIRNLVKTPVDTWPESFQPFKNILVENGKILLDDKKMMLYAIPASKADIHPLVRRSIALEILKWIQPVAKSIEQSSKHNGSLSGPLQMLQPLSIENKRHVQLVSNIVDLTYDPEKNVTLIRIPYSDKEISIQNQDLTKTACDNIIIRQVPNRTVNHLSPWQLTIKQGAGRYLLDLIDMSYRPNTKKRSKFKPNKR